MKLCRFQIEPGEARVGVLAPRGNYLLDLTDAGVTQLDTILESPNVIRTLTKLLKQTFQRHAIRDIQLLAPVDRQEVWAVGVTYLRSKAARMDESSFSATAYDRVYDATRPELFFKSQPHKVVGTDGKVGIRRDAKWNVPEPELVLVFNSQGALVGYTIGNDMSSRDIEGENLLYLPQAKIYDRSCALGPYIVVGASEKLARRWTISIVISRRKREVFRGSTSVARIKRSFGELQEYLFRSQTFSFGAMLLTGTGVVPGDDFTLRRGDVVNISISGIGTLENTVTVV